MRIVRRLDRLTKESAVLFFYYKLFQLSPSGFKCFYDYSDLISEVLDHHTGHWDWIEFALNKVNDGDMLLSNMQPWRSQVHIYDINYGLYFQDFLFTCYIMIHRCITLNLILWKWIPCFRISHACLYWVPTLTERKVSNIARGILYFWAIFLKFALSGRILFSLFLT